MTEKENVLHALRHDGKAEWIANITDSVRSFTVPQSRDKVKEGLDWFGVRWRDFSPLNEPLFEDISEWKERVVFPDLDAIDWKTEAERLLPGLERESKALWLSLSQGLFERLHSLLGFEYGATSFYDDPEATLELIGALTDFRLKLMERLIDLYDPDIVDYRDDYGTQTSLFFSPEIFDAFFLPSLKRIADYVHARGKVFVFHSCGKVDPLVGRFAALGADTWDSVMPCCDLPALYAQYGDRLGFSSNMDMQKFDFCTEEEARAVVRYYIDTLGGRNNLLLWDLYPMKLKLDPAILRDEIRTYGRLRRS